MRIWIDIANAPHVRLFVPVVECLRGRGDDILLTARDHRETAALARATWPDVDVDGSSSPAGRVAKGRAIAARAAHLRRRARTWRPDVALGHNSYAQIIAARLAGVSTVTAMDYEHQPANHVAFRLAQRVIVPEAFPPEALRRFGADESRVRRYAGVKEEAYFTSVPDASGVRAALGIPEDVPLVVLRLPPDGALYHTGENALVEAAVTEVRRGGGTVLVLARSEGQRAAWRDRAGDAIRVAEPPVDTPALLAAADGFVGAGGTMTREAAVLGIPTYSIFAGKPAAVDAWLERQGRLTIVRNTSQLEGVAARRSGELQPTAYRSALLDAILDSLQDVGR